MASQARELFESSKFDEKQQLLNFFFSNLTLDREKLDVELREPFNLMSKSEDHLIWRHIEDTFRSGKAEFGFSVSHIKTVCISLGIAKPTL